MIWSEQKDILGKKGSKLNNQVIESKEGLNKFYGKIYGLLGIGISISALVAYLVMNVFRVQVLFFFYTKPMAFTIIWLAEIALVLLLSFKAAKQPTLAMSGFIAYSFLNGLTLAVTLQLYTQATIFGAFISTAATFFAMSLIGVFTKRDLSALGHAAYSALLGVFIALLLNAFLLHSEPVDYAISILMVLIFSGLTAYDNQKIRSVYYNSMVPSSTGVAVFLALQLYLDFINLFLSFVSILGGKNN